MEVVLHTCCGPCASACVRRLQEKNCKVVMYFSNSNIDSREEFELRVAAAKRLADVDGVEIAIDDYDHEAWLRAVKGLENEPERGKRCDACFRFNIARAAEFAKSRGIAKVTSSLTVSPHKSSARVFAAGDEVAGDMFLHEDFKKKDGFLCSIRRAKELKLYRQGYCGCEFSKRRNDEASKQREGNTK